MTRVVSTIGSICLPIAHRGFVVAALLALPASWAGCGDATDEGEPQDAGAVPNETDGSSSALADAGPEADVSECLSETTATKPSARQAALPHLRVQERTGLVSIARASGFDGGALRFSLISAPIGVTIDACSGVLSIDSDTLSRQARLPLRIVASNELGSATANQTLTVGPQIGFSIPLNDLKWETDDVIESTMMGVASMSSTYVRIDLYWNEVERRQGNLDLAVMDRIVHRARAAGQQVVFIVHNTPSWARPSRPGSDHEPPDDLTDYRRFLVAMVQHFSGPLQVRHWEIWNEPNLASFWPHDASPAKLMELHRAAYAAIKSADPTARVISAGLSPVPGEGDAQHRGAIDFLRSMYENELASTSDAIGFHPYTWPYPPTQPDSWSGFEMMRGAMQDLKTEFGDQAKPTWITEYGAPTGGSANAVTEDEQRAALETAYDLCATYPWAGPLLWYSYKDRGQSVDDTESWYGALRPDGSRKPVADALQSILRGDLPKD